MKRTASATSSERRPSWASAFSAMLGRVGVAPELVQHDAGRDLADAQAVRRDLAAEAVHEALDGVLGGAVDRLPVQRGVAGDRARHDDVARAALDHAGQHGADGAEDAGDVDRDHLLPGGGVAVLDVAGDVDAGVGEEDVDAAEAVVHGGDHAVDLGRGGRGRWAGRGCPAAPMAARTASRRSAERAARARRAPSRAEHPRERAADAGAGAGDERDLAGERRLHRPSPSYAAGAACGAGGLSGRRRGGRGGRTSAGRRPRRGSRSRACPGTVGRPQNQKSSVAGSPTGHLQVRSVSCIRLRRRAFLAISARLASASALISEAGGLRRHRLAGDGLGAHRRQRVLGHRARRRGGGAAAATSGTGSGGLVEGRLGRRRRTSSGCSPPTRLERPRRWTLPITALRVTPPSSLAIWLALLPSDHMDLRVSTRSSVQDISDGSVRARWCCRGRREGAPGVGAHSIRRGPGVTSAGRKCRGAGAN